MIKPDGVRRGLTADILAIFLRKGYRLLGLKLMRISRELAERHYAEHQGKAFFEPLLAFMTGGPVVAMVLAEKRAGSCLNRTTSWLNTLTSR